MISQINELQNQINVLDNIKDNYVDADKELEAELNNNIENVKKTLEEAIKILSARLQNTENKVKQLNDKTTAMIVIFSSIIVLINGGMITLALVWKKRKGL